MTARLLTKEGIELLKGEKEAIMWWLISSGQAEKIKQALVAPTHEANAYNCDRQGCLACAGDSKRDEAYILIDTGLHITDIVPSDSETDIPSRQRVREWIDCILHRCNLKAHSEADAKLISQFVKDFWRAR